MSYSTGAELENKRYMTFEKAINKVYRVSLTHRMICFPRVLAGKKFKITIIDDD